MHAYLSDLPEDNIRLMYREMEKELRKYQIRVIVLEAEKQRLEQELKNKNKERDNEYKDN